MPQNARSKRPTHLPRACLLVLVTLVIGGVAEGCGGTSHGGSSQRPTAATGDAANSTASTSPSSSISGESPGLAFARCMRANGVPNFPDPLPGRGLQFSVNPDAPAVRSAHAKCQKLLPGGGPPGPGSHTHPSEGTLVKLTRIAQCMRHHGVPQFPDPRTSVPANAGQGQYQEITDFDGAILLFPPTINLQAPAYRQALHACGAKPLGLPH